MKLKAETTSRKAAELKMEKSEKAEKEMKDKINLKLIRGIKKS